MRLKLVHRWFITLCALLLLGLSAGTLGCSSPWSSTPQTTLDATSLTNQAIYQLQSALGLSDGAIARSTQPPILARSDVSVTWIGGKADIDLSSGHVRAVLVDPAQQGSDTTLSDTELENAADRLVGLLGWSSAALETQGFTGSGTKLVDYGQAGTVYQKTWAGHDPQGVPNEGVIEVGVDAVTGALHSFLFSPGPDSILDKSDTITKEAAIQAAIDAAVQNLTALATTTSSTAFKASTSTTSSTTTSTTTMSTTVSGSPFSSSIGDSTPTTLPDTVLGATLIHTNKPGITGGKDLLVWMVELAGDAASGEASSTVYVDAMNGKALVVSFT